MRADQQDPKPLRCAIYTRQSVQDGLESDFSTLDAQRESALAYISSQRAAGWVALPDRYDDAGYTGANTDRPALKRLMERGAKAWADVPDGAAWVDGLRGGDAD